MKQQLDEVRTLAIKLFEAGQVQKRKEGSYWNECDRNRVWHELTSESVAVWDAVAICAYNQLRNQNDA